MVGEAECIWDAKPRRTATAWFTFIHSFDSFSPGAELSDARGQNWALCELARRPHAAEEAEEAEEAALGEASSPTQGGSDPFQRPERA